MKNFFASAIVAATVAQGADIFNFLNTQVPEDFPTDVGYGEPIHQSIKISGFGNTVEEHIYANNFTETYIKTPNVPFVQDYATQISHLERMAEFHDNLKNLGDPSPVYTCANNHPFNDDPTSPFMWSGEFGGLVTDEVTSVSFPGKCFEQITHDL